MTTTPPGSPNTANRTSPARWGPPPEERPRKPPAPPPPPRWRGWLLLVGLAVSMALFLLPVPTSNHVQQLSYTPLKSDLQAGQVARLSATGTPHMPTSSTKTAPSLHPRPGSRMTSHLALAHEPDAEPDRELR